MTAVADCYHCGDPLPDGTPITASVAGSDRPMCCIGCKAVAEFIASSGLESFYDFRSTPDPDLNLTPEATAWQHYDDPHVLDRYVHSRDGDAETTLDIGGMYCSACVWLLNKALQQVPGIVSVDVNPAVRRAVIRWDCTATSFSGLLEAVAHVGFKPSPVGLGELPRDKNDEYRAALKRLIVAGAAGMQVMMFAVALYAGDYFGIDGDIERFLRIISLLVTVPIISYSARPFLIGAWRGLRARSPGMDLPVSIAILAAFAASTYATSTGRGDIYFDSIAMFVFFLSATRYLEMRARHRSNDHATALAQLLPDTALRVHEDRSERIAIDRLRISDHISVLPGDVLPVDGTVVAGEISIDESMLTGESQPVARRASQPVFAGTINRAGNATVSVQKIGASTSLAEIGRMLDRAKADRPPAVILADRVASYFVVAVLMLTVAAALYWYNVDPSRAFEIALATLVVTCPCALALATPAALAAATSRLAKSGFLLVRSRILDVLARPAVVVFDKTGTLTAGRPVIRDTQVLDEKNMDAAACLRIATALENASEHVLARAFDQPITGDTATPLNVNAVSGSGLEATIDDQRFRIGSSAYVAALSGSELPMDEPSSAHSLVYLGDTRRILARFVIGDALRSDAVDTVDGLRTAGFDIVIASGDREAAVEEVARQLQIDCWHARLSPADKLQLIADLQQHQSVIMVGDGINDAPVLAAADGSIALDAGTALARASADAVSLGSQLGTINHAVRIAQQTRRIVRQNIAWAIVYNATAVPLAVSGMLAPWMAAIGMSASSLVVVLNALRLHRDHKVVGRASTLDSSLPAISEVLP